MRKVILITSGLLLTTMLQAQSWQLKPWEKYIIEKHVKQDTAITCQSVMGLPSTPKPFETRLYRTVTGSEMIGNLPRFKKKSKSIFGNSDPSQSVFAEQDAATERARMVEGEHDSGFGIFSVILSTVADIIDHKLKVKNK